ncbi:MAG: hypothetical protein ACK56F_19860, partial [bacterium]
VALLLRTAPNMALDKKLKCGRGAKVKGLLFKHFPKCSSLIKAIKGEKGIFVEFYGICLE